MLVYVKTSNRKTATVVQVQSAYLFEAINRWWQTENALDADSFWKFKQEICEQGEPVDMARGHVITLKPYKRLLVSQINQLIADETEQHTLSQNGYTELNSSAVLRSLAEMCDDGVVDLVYNLRVKVKPEQMGDFLNAFEDLLQTYHTETTSDDITDDDVDAALTEAQG
jgi:hypothetical protein